MTEPALRRRGATRWRALVLVAAAAALLAGCDLATGTVRTATELEEAGIRNPNLHYDGGTATLEYDADPNPLEARAEQDQAAAIIWRNLPFRIDADHRDRGRGRVSRAASTRGRCWSSSWGRGRPTWTARWRTSPGGPR